MFFKHLVLSCLLWGFVRGNQEPNELLKVGPGSEDASITEVPYIVSIQYYARHTCGGSLVAPAIVVSTAHCLYGKRTVTPFNVRAGSDFHDKGGQLRAVVDFSYHSSYDSRSTDYDISLLRLSAPFQLSDTIAVIHLANAAGFFDDGAQALVSGWGRNKAGGTLSSQLQKFIVPVVNHAACVAAYNATHYHVTPRMICAGIDIGGVDSCQGDSGGPLVIDGLLTGVVSWGRGCAMPGFPGVYSNIPALREWLDYEISNMMIDADLEAVEPKADHYEGYLSPEIREVHNNTGRIVGGKPCDISEVPYVVSLQRGNVGHACGATIIDKDMIITAAHCVHGQNANSFSIRAGSNYHNRGGQYKRITSVKIHENYNPSTLDYDIAILRLSDPLSLGKVPAAAALPQSRSSVSDGTTTRVSGWGSLNEGGAAARELQTVFLPIINQQSCTQSYKKYYPITARMLCAGIASGGQDACQGDSGGPLVTDGTLVGVVSWGVGCARPGYPGVYTKVSELRDWIDQTVRKMRSQWLPSRPYTSE